MPHTTYCSYQQTFPRHVKGEIILNTWTFVTHIFYLDFYTDPFCQRQLQVCLMQKNRCYVYTALFHKETTEIMPQQTRIFLSYACVYHSEPVPLKHWLTVGVYQLSDYFLTYISISTIMKLASRLQRVLKYVQYRMILVMECQLKVQVPHIHISQQGCVES